MSTTNLERFINFNSRTRGMCTTALCGDADPVHAEFAGNYIPRVPADRAS